MMEEMREPSAWNTCWTYDSLLVPKRVGAGTEYEVFFKICCIVL